MALTLSPTPVLSVRGEPELVAATRAGDDRAFEQLYARYRERIFAFISSRVHDHGRAEDIAQDVFISALRRMRAGDQEIAFKPWIYEIAKNACIDEFRRGHRSREVPFESDPDIPADRPATVSPLPTPAAAVESKQRMEDLRGAFGVLSETHHRLLVLREFEGLSYDEIGERLGMSRQMVESSLFRARRKLADEYQELASGRRCAQVRVAIDAGSLASARALGLRDRRRFARHLSHCQACRHLALMAGVDQALVRPRSIPAKIAALLPFPFAGLRWPWGRKPSGGPPGSAGSSHSVTAAAAQTGPVLAEQAGASALALAPVAAAALAIAGIGGGLVYNSVASGQAGHPVAVSHTAAHRSVGSGPSSGPRSHAGLAGARRAGSAGVTSHGTAPAVRRTAPGMPPGARPGKASAGGSSGARSGGRSASTTATAPLKQAVSGTVGTVGKVVQGATSTAGSTLQGVTKTASGTIQGVATTASQTVQGVGSAASGAVQGATSTASGAAQGATTTATSTAQGVTNGLQQAASGATSPVSQTAGQTTQAVGQTTQTTTTSASGLLP